MWGIKYVGQINRVTNKGKRTSWRNCSLCTLLRAYLNLILCDIAMETSNEAKLFFGNPSEKI